jgi:signal transduction histidine kinase
VRQALGAFLVLLAGVAVLGYVAGAQRSAMAHLAWGLAAVVVVALPVALVVVVLRGVAVAMSGLAGAMRRFGGGELSARAPVAGPSDLRQMARDFNAMAEAVSGEVAQRERARRVTREAGARIRAHLRARDVINEARVVIEDELDADAAWLYLMDEQGKLGLPVGHEEDWLLPREFIEEMPAEMMAWVGELFRTRDAMVFQDLTGPEGNALPPPVIDPVRAAGIVSHLLVPFGGESEMLGLITAERMRPGHPWTRPEIEAVESIAADIGRGLHHARLYEQEQHLVAELKSVNEMRTEFFATVAHELRSPLTGIEGYLEMLREGEAGPVSDAQQGMLEAIARGTERLQNLIDDLFTLAKLEAGAGKPEIGRVELASVVAGAAEALRPSAEAGGLAIASACPPGLAVDGNAGQLDRVLVNLLSNAVKFTPAGGKISVTAAAEDGRAVVSVRDSGIGIPERDRGRLFSRFFRASNAVRRGIPGTGLGLAIVQAIIASHGGEIALQSQEGIGTAITVSLPLADCGQHPENG